MIIRIRLGQFILGFKWKKYLKVKQTIHLKKKIYITFYFTDLCLGHSKCDTSSISCGSCCCWTNFVSVLVDSTNLVKTVCCKKKDEEENLDKVLSVDLGKS